MTEQNLIKFFELERILQWVKLTCSKIIALQLPDRYLKYSFEISEYLKNHSENEYYVLADTSFRRLVLNSHYTGKCLLPARIRTRFTSASKKFKRYVRRMAWRVEFLKRKKNVYPPLWLHAPHYNSLFVTLLHSVLVCTIKKYTL